MKISELYGSQDALFSSTVDEKIHCIRVQKYSSNREYVELNVDGRCQWYNTVVADDTFTFLDLIKGSAGGQT